jgi:ribonuclease HII
MPRKILLHSSYTKDPDTIEVGIDEAGRGALAGPVTVACAIMPYGFQHELIKDSKLLNESSRAEARKLVMDNALAYYIKHVNVEDIISENILEATFKGMNICLEETEKQRQFDFIIVDGNEFPGYKNVPFAKVKKGDNTYVSVAAASILAKTERDNYMKELAQQEEYGVYVWGSNKGYGTKQHRDAIKNHGISEYHRRQFVKNIEQEIKNNLF